MHSLDDLRNIRKLEMMLGILPGEPTCLDHCSPEERQYWKDLHRPTSRGTPQGETAGCMVLDVKTNKLAVYRCYNCKREDKPECQYKSKLQTPAEHPNTNS